MDDYDIELQKIICKREMMVTANREAELAKQHSRHFDYEFQHLILALNDLSQAKKNNEGVENYRAGHYMG